MSGKLIDGEAIANRIIEEVRKDVEELKKQGFTPKLVSILVGDDPGSKVYVAKQAKSAESVGIHYELKELPKDANEYTLLSLINELNNDTKVNAIILQVPLPKGINERKAQSAISHIKDPEGIHPHNLGNLVLGVATLSPCTALAALECMKSTNVKLEGANVVIVGRSEIVGKPLALLLLMKPFPSATPTVCHTRTKELFKVINGADVIVAAAGRAEFIKGEWIKPGAIVVDVGINVVPMLDENGNQVLNKKGKPRKKIVGDVEFSKAAERAGFITPVPGGVGPVATAMLLRNTITCAKIQKKL